MQTNALLAFAGVKKVDADPHQVFDDVFSPPQPATHRRPRTPQERADRHALIARLAGGA